MTAETNGPGREPTQEMIAAGRATWIEFCEAYGGPVPVNTTCVGPLWRAMWDAAPPAPAPAPDADAAKMVSDWLTHAKSCGRGIQEMVRVEGAEIIMTGLLAQVECNRIDLNDARGTIRRQRERIEQQTRELADTRHALIAQARQWQERAKRAEADLAAVGAAIKETK